MWTWIISWYLEIENGNLSYPFEAQELFSKNSNVLSTMSSINWSKIQISKVPQTVHKLLA